MDSEDGATGITQKRHIEGGGNLCWRWYYLSYFLPVYTTYIVAQSQSGGVIYGSVAAWQVSHKVMPCTKVVQYGIYLIFPNKLFKKRTTNEGYSVSFGIAGHERGWLKREGGAVRRVS